MIDAHAVVVIVDGGEAEENARVRRLVDGAIGGAVFAWLGTPTMMTNYLLTLDLSVTWILIIVMTFIFLLGWPLEWVPIVLIIVPILLPVVDKLGFNLTWFGILVAVNLQTAWLSPPVALSAYFLKEVVEPLSRVFGHPGKVFFRQNPGIKELEGKGDNLVIVGPNTPAEAIPEAKDGQEVHRRSHLLLDADAGNPGRSRKK